MIPADDLAVGQLIGKHIAFKAGDEHRACWHSRAGIQTGVVLRPVLSMAQKAELLASEGIAPPDLPEEDGPPRLWVRADSCPSFPRGCELAVEQSCLLLDGP